MHLESMFDQNGFSSILVAADPDLLWGDAARHFVRAAALDTSAHAAEYFGCAAHLIERLDAQTLIAAADVAGVKQMVTSYAPVGPVADALALLAPKLAREGIHLAQVRRPWDSSFWPHAKKGFFPFKEQIPALLRDHGFAT
jgi:deoxyribodipyrimidine photo-lyase